MTDFNQYQFGFIGLGLIGGSIAKAIRKYWPGARITAYNPSKDTLEEALSDGVVNDGRCRDDFPEGVLFDGALFDDCDVVFLCAPVQKNAENLSAVKGHLKESAILTDIGSTKRDILNNVEREGLGRWFIGGHPMTGSERTRYHNSKASLLENAYYMLAPSDEVSQEKVDILTELVNGFRAIPLRITCDFHDYAVAGISHVPHVISAGLVNLVKQSDSKDQIMHTIAAGGFRDITRISSSSPVMWEQICLTNGDNITALLDDYIRELTDIRDRIAEHRADDIHAFFDSARNYRDSFGESRSGARNLLHIITVEIEDHPGMLAEVVSLLAVNAVNIKNIGIQHNREYQYGTLRVEFYSEEDRAEAIDILTTRNYTVHAQD